MHRLPLLAALLFAASAHANLLSGPIHYEGTGHDYYLTSQSNWTDAEALAVSMGGHLASISDAAENAWVCNTFSAYGGMNRQLWIGLNDLGSPGQFGWSSGEAVTFTNWSPGEPNYIGDERFVYIYGPGIPRPAGQWNNEYNRSDFASWGASGRFFGVIEVVPAPPATALVVMGMRIRGRRRQS
jgi:hypothetical protein